MRDRSTGISYTSALQHLYTHHQDYWRRDRKYSQKAFLNDIRSSDSDWKDPSPASVTRALTGVASPLWLKSRLQNQKVREKIEGRLGIKGAISCRSYVFIDDQVELAKNRAHELSRGNKERRASAFAHTFESLRIVTPGGHNPVAPVERGERGALRTLAREILHPQNPIVHWAAEPWSGASIIAYSLAFHSDIVSNFSRLVILHSHSTTEPFERELSELAERLGIDASRLERPDRIAEVLYSQNILLVVCGACYIPFKEYADKNLMRRLLKEVMERHSRGEPARVLTIGRSDALDAIAKRMPAPGHLFSLSHELNESMKLKPGDRFFIFRKQWTRYRNIRECNQIELGGSRLKRAYWHYEATQNKTVFPANVRLRAYFASNSVNYSYFDPTAGFWQLCGDDKEPPIDIQLIYEEISGYLRLKFDGTNIPDIRSLRLCSTAKHWLSEAALEDLRQRRGSEAKVAAKCDIAPAELSLNAFNSRADDPNCPLMSFTRQSPKDVPDADEPEQVYSVGLGVRAIVQDQWREHAQDERALAHWRVARRLFLNQDDKDLLRREFPYKKHYGRSRIYFLGNTLTHLIRSIEEVAFDDEAYVAPKSTDGFPDPPKKGRGGCDPRQVLEFCYSTLFQRELNGNRIRDRRSGGVSRSLSKRHGTFEYAAELLQLMSCNYQIGIPHPALPEKMRNEFVRECGFALLDIGELGKAQTCFESVLKQEDVPKEIEVDERLNLALVLSERMHLDRAEREVNTASALIDAATENQISPKVAKASSRRILARRAHLSYLREDYAETLRLIEAIEKIEADRGLTLSESDLLHLKVASLARSREKHTEALCIAMVAGFRSGTDGLQHEAMGFRVAAAHALRKIGEPNLSEKVLDDLMTDLLKYGSSERTLLSTCLEAGRVMIDQGRVFRAYASYLRPCVHRAYERGFARYARSGAAYATIALNQIEALFDISTEEEWAQKIKDATDEEKKFVKQDRPRSDGFFEVDPLFGYFLSESSEVIHLLRNIDNVIIERRKIEAIKASLE